jgi:L-asparaginase
VIQGRYETSKHLLKMGVISGHDMTTEAAITKLMFTLAQMDSIDAVKLIMQTDIRGELTQPY